MNQARAFLQAIQEEPEDDTPRLVFADWLDDHGQEDRAALIRAQVRLARLSEDDPTREPLADEADGLLARHEAEWTAAISPHVLAWRWSRGFIERVTITADSLMHAGAAVFAAAPVRAVRLILPPNEARELADCPHLAQIETLDLRATHDEDGYRTPALTDRPLLQLLTSPHWERLRELDLFGQGLESLPGVWDRLSGQVERLNLSGNRGIGDRGVRAILSTGSPRLRELGLLGTNLTPAGVLGLLRTENLPALADLDLDLGVCLRRGQEGALAEILAAPLVPQLQQLRISEVPLTDQQVALLASTPALADLRRLSLRGCGLVPRDAARLADSPYLAGLTDLSLLDCSIAAEGTAALAHSPYLTHLRRLRLLRCSVGAQGCVALAASRHLAQLQTLDLSYNHLGAPAFEALSQANWPGLRDLRLDNNHVGTVGAEILATASWLPHLSELHLARGGLTPDGLEALVRSSRLGRLETLNLGENSLGDAAVRLLAGCPELSRLRALGLSHNNITGAGISALIDSPHLPRLRALTIRGTNLLQEDRERLRARFGPGVLF